MMATTPERLLTELEWNYNEIQRHLKGLGHMDLLLQLPFGGNCANWVLGHIIEGRNDMLKFLSRPMLWDDAACKIYRSGSAPIKGADSPHLSFECLHMDLKAIHNDLAEALASISQADLDSETAYPEDGGLANLMARMLWHETYHVGQLEILRGLARPEDESAG
jgi:hypothetical protein